MTSYLGRPALYAPSTAAFWNDEHISKGMLSAHLNPDHEGASRQPEFVQQSVDWIASLFSPKTHPTLLDLGCGPGIYAEKFHQAGFHVTGIDLSERSIEYAKNEAQRKQASINYRCQNYLDLKINHAFDVVALIYCDYGALIPEDRKQLLANIYRALKPSGMFLLDVFSDHHFSKKKENQTYDYFPKGGFWLEKAHLCLQASYQYDEKINVDQYIIVSNDTINCYHIWEQYFSRAKLNQELKQAGFINMNYYDDIRGHQNIADSHTLCATARKEEGRQAG